MKNLRRGIQVLSFALFLWLLLRTAYPLPARVFDFEFPVELFQRMSPFSALSGMLASRAFILSFLPALAVLLATAVLGRFFCGWICPLGTTIDMTDRLVRKGKRVKDGAGHRGFKFLLLSFCLVSALFGVQAAGWFDPLSIATRSYALAVHPYVHFWMKGALDIASRLEFLEGPSLKVYDVLTEKFFLLVPKEPLFSQHIAFTLILLAIALVSVLARRYWCRSLCPLGAMLSLVSRYALLSRRVSDRCSSCGRCERHCKMGAVESEGKATAAGECIECMWCEDVCPESAVRFLPQRKVRPKLQPVFASRRDFLISVGAGLAAVPAMKLNYAFKKQVPDLIRPPGARGEDEFLARCVRCGECMKVCVTGGLQPTLFEAGIEGLWTPKLVPRIGYCEYNCTLCGQVCPSDAIERLTEQEKHKTIIGTAFIDRNLCIPWEAASNWKPGKEWSDKFNCLVCEEACPVPTKAIKFNPFEVDTPEGKKRILRPEIIKKDCIGCGICETLCPIKGKPAVYVISPQPDI